MPYPKHTQEFDCHTIAHGLWVLYHMKRLCALFEFQFQPV